jgi:hypothetical protein
MGVNTMTLLGARHNRAAPTGLVEPRRDAPRFCTNAATRLRTTAATGHQSEERRQQVRAATRC